MRKSQIPTEVSKLNIFMAPISLIDPFQASVPLLYTLKKFDAFKGYESGTSARYG